MIDDPEVTQMGKRDISFETKTEEGVDVIDLSGKLDSFTTPDLKAELKRLTDVRHYKLVLGFQNVDHINSTAIGAMIAVAQEVRRRGGDLKLFGMKEDIRKVFDLVGASRVLEIFGSEQEALRSFS
jgi:anti-sigma B factor antagonist